MATPYDYMENWLIRDDATCAFAVHADIIYLQDRLFDDMSALASMHAYAQSAVGGGRFGGTICVYSPLVANADDLEKALKWYFRHQHTGKRPFFFIGEGRGGALLKAYEEENADSLKGDGFAGSFYTDNRDADFVTDKTIRDIHNAILRVRYREQWGREMPEGKIKE